MSTSKAFEEGLLRWSPSRSSAVALVTEAGMVLAYAALGHASNNPIVQFLVGLILLPVLSVGVPVYWTTVVNRQPLSALGLTLRRWPLAVGLGLALTAFEVVHIWAGLPSATPVDEWLPQAVTGMVALWEPLFVFGWLQLCFEKDFGVLAGIIVAPACFALYHIGFGFSLASVLGQFTGVLIYAIAFRMATNLIVVWPLLWGASSARVCIERGVCALSWTSVVFTFLLLVVEVIFMALMARRQRRASMTLP
jgi:membrane protease YdiL (CAAX protease family)